MIDKNQAVIDYLIQCPDIAQSPLYFNLIQAKDNSIQILTSADDKDANQKFIDGSVGKRTLFTLIAFKSISDAEIVTGDNEFSNENIDEVQYVQTLIDWIDEQNVLRNFPNFGENCIIDSISTTTDNPRLDGINTDMTPPLAMYSIVIVIEYLDISKVNK